MIEIGFGRGSFNHMLLLIISDPPKGQQRDGFNGKTFTRNVDYNFGKFQCMQLT